MRRLLCILAVALVICQPAFAASIVSSAATRRVQQRVEELLQHGTQLNPESLLLTPQKERTNLAAAAAFSDAVAEPAKSVSRFSIAAPRASPDAAGVATAAAAEPQGRADTAAVGVAAKELHIKWAVKQSGTITLESDEDGEVPYLSENEAGALLKKYGSQLVQRQPQLEFVDVISHDQQDSSDEDEHREHREHEEESGEQQHRHPEDSQERAELINRLTQVDWQGVFEAAQREAAAEEAATEEARHAEAEARRAELKQRIQQAEEEMRQADEERQKAEEERLQVIEERQKEVEELRKAAEQREEASEQLQHAAAEKEHAAEERQKAVERAEEIKREAAEEARALKERVVEEERKKAEAERHRRQQDEHAQKQKPSSLHNHGKDYKDDKDDKYDDDEDDYSTAKGSSAHRAKVLVQEKSRSPLRYFPGGGIYSFTSELTCISDNEYYEKMAYKTFPLITPRMTKVTVGLCEWTVTEVSPTQVNKNVFLLGNAWGTCTFLPIAEKECGKPIVGGLTLTVQALVYQFALPKGIREAEAGELEGAAAAAAPGKAVTAAKVATAAATSPAASKLAQAGGKAQAAVSTAAASRFPQAAGANSTAVSTKAKSGVYLMDVELQNVFLGLVTGAFGPKKAHKYKQGAVQFAYGPPPDTAGKSFAIETRLAPAHLGGPSLEELQEGMVQLVPSTYQIVFDEE